MAPEPSASAAVRPPLLPYQRTAEEVITALGSDARRGLRTAEIADRLARHGRNELPADPPVPAWRRFLAQFGDVLTALLLVATAISLVAWWIERESPLPYEALTILAIVLVNAVLGFVQEGRAEQALRALGAMTAPTARVRRDGEPQQVPTAELVPGDVLLLEEGDGVAADARVIESIALRMTESALTGESAPVGKRAEALAGEVDLADRKDMVYRGTAVAAGRGRAVVTATGADTELGRIAGSLRSEPEPATPLQQELDRVGKRLGAAVIAIAAVVAATLLFLEDLRTVSELVSVLILAVSLAVAAVPEGLTAITTIVLSLGTQRMARRNVIVRKLASVETLGATTVICSDKTGTLTKNEMTVRTVVTAGGAAELSGIGYEPAGDLALRPTAPAGDGALREEVGRALLAGALANNAALVRHGARWAIRGDPTEAALLVAARKAGHAAEALEARYPRLGEVPFSSERKLMSTLHADAEDPSRAVLFSKGAPDVLLARCTAEQVGAETRPLGGARRQEIAAEVAALGAAALRTLGVAWRPLARADARAPYEALEERLVFLGVVGMIDPPRAEVREAVKVARGAGLRPILITGDHPVTASAIAAELGIAPRGARAIAGAELQAMDEAALRAAVRTVSVFARVAPEHKLRIVRALSAEGEIAAMTGDGVNDAPALKSAHIGIAMGITGTDVAKGAADMVLLDDDFASIVAAVEEGRSIFGNIQRFLRFLLSSNIGEVLVMFLGVVAAGIIGLVPEQGSALVTPLVATQILWINLLTDAAPALALGVEPADPDVMHRPPRDPRSPVIAPSAWGDILLLGAVMAVGTLGLVDWALPDGLITSPGVGRAGTLDRARTLAFTVLVLFQLFNTFNARFEEHSAFHRLGANRWLWGAVASSAALQVAVVHVPFLQRSFHTVPLGLRDWAACTAVASAVLWVEELRKWALRHRARRRAR